jgi:hypothetical protein
VKQMRQFFAYAFVAALVVLLAAPIAAGANDVTISGTITDSASGSPVAGAKVTFSYWVDVVFAERDSTGASSSEPVEYSVVTGADGTFSVPIAPGSYGVFVEASGFERYYGSLDTAYESQMAVLLTKLPPYDAQLSITVKDSQSGLGVAGASVYGWPDFTYGGDVGILGFPSYQEISGTTDAAGKFQSGIWSGAYTLSVSASGYFYASESIQVNGADLAHTIELTPVPAPNSTLSGDVVNQSTGAPIAGAEIWVYPDYSYMGANCWGGYDTPDAVYTDAAGHYSVAVYGGASSISVYADGFYSYWGNVNVPDNFAMNFDVALFPIVEPDKVSALSGKVVDENGGSVAGATVQVTYWPSSFGYDLMRMEGQTGATGAPTGSDASGGGIGFDLVAPPTNGFDGAYYGSQPWYYEATTDAGGKYGLPVPVGEMSVSVWVEGYYPYYGWTSIDHAGSFWLNATLSAVPEPDATISGAVCDATTGMPIEGAYVSAYLVRDPVEMYDLAASEGLSYGMGGADSASSPAPNVAPDKLGYMDSYGYYYSEAVTDADGKFSIEVPHGQQALGVWAEGYAYYSTTLSLEDGQALVVELSLARSSDESVIAGGMNSDGSGKRYVMPMTGDMNTLPAMGGSARMSIAPGESREVVMTDVFQGGAGLSFSYDAPENLRVSYDEASGTLKVTAPQDWTGEEDITLKATDGTATVYKTMSVSVAPQSSFAVIAGFTAAIVIAALVIAAIWKTQRE